MPVTMFPATDISAVNNTRKSTNKAAGNWFIYLKKNNAFQWIPEW